MLCIVDVVGKLLVDVWLLCIFFVFDVIFVCLCILVYICVGGYDGLLVVGKIVWFDMIVCCCLFVCGMLFVFDIVIVNGDYIYWDL